ncbi:MAG: ATP phosphoribosyltransferase regulatory subunit [Mycoplasmoidaceae bacterium]|nr:ATP phosphoribosyltransferase regulatory subunit [Mycoplasmoidaceae bacterium]
MIKFPKIRGTEDRFDLDAKNINTLTDIFSYLAKLNGYKRMITPIMENADLFIRSVGDSSDIVTKEFYDFKDKGDRRVVLRPEGTAGVIRALIEEKLIYSKQLPIKAYYFGPMFRYERPQSGRLRQFNQFGIECVGTNNLYDDADMLVFANNCLKTLGLKQYTISINNIGNFESRKK